MNMPIQSMHLEFPVEALPELARAACHELSWMIKVALSMTGSCMIPAMATGVQDRAVVRLPNGKHCPLMVYAWTDAESGSGKTPVDHAIFRPFREHDLQAKTAFEEASVAYQAQMRIWCAEDKALQKRLRSRIESGASAEDVRSKLLEHASRVPPRPHLRQILYQNVSEAGLYEALAGKGESVAIVCDEAGDIMKGEVMANVALQNAIWSGADNLPVNRAHGRRIQISQPRMTLSLMTQPAVFEKLMSSKGDALRANGYFARFLFARPMSTKGYRRLGYAEDGYEPVHLAALHERFRALLRQRDERYARGDVEPEVIELSGEAKGLWLDIHNTNEAAMLPGGYLETVSDFGSKVMENLGRIAAILHLFDGQTGPISRDTLQRASVIMNWYMGQFMGLFGPGSRRSQVQRDADELVAYMSLRWWREGVAASRRDAARGPIRGARFEAALLLLQNQGVVFVSMVKRKRWIHYIQYNRSPCGSLSAA